MCYISMDSFRRALQTNEKFFFSKFQISVRNFDRKPKNFQTNREAWILIKLQCIIYQWIWLDKLYKLMERFVSNFNWVFKLLAENRKIFKPLEYWSKCNVAIIYQWIWLDKLYKLMESFFSIFGIISCVGFMQARCGRHLC